MPILSEAINIDSSKKIEKRIHNLEFYSYTLESSVGEKFEVNCILDSK